MVEQWGGTPTGRPNAVAVARACFGHGLTKTAISGGALDLNDMSTGDSQDTLTVDSVSILSAAVTFITDLATTAPLVVNDINAQASLAYWASIKIGATDWVEIWPKNGTASTGALTVSGTDTGFTPAYVNMNTEQAFVAAVATQSWNNGLDFFPDTKMYQLDLSFTMLSSLLTDSTITDAKGVELVVEPEDQVVSFYMGGGGPIRATSARETVIDIRAVALGEVKLFAQAAAATNMNYRIRVW